MEGEGEEEGGGEMGDDDAIEDAFAVGLNP